MTILFVLFYARMWTWDGSKYILRILADGLTLNFIYMVFYSLMHRPYHRFIFYRYGLGYHTVTSAAVYLSLIVSVLFVRAFLKYRKTRSVRKSWPELILLGVGNAYLLLTLSRNGFLAVGVTGIFMIILLACMEEESKWKAMLRYVGMTVGSFCIMFPIVFTLTRIMPAVNNDPVLSEVELTGHHIDKGEPADSRLYMDIEHFYNVGIYKVLGINSADFATEIFVVNDEILLASNEEDVEMDSLNDVSNGRLDIFKAYIENWNLTGHEDMNITMPNGELMVHAHNVYLQVIHDHGLITGVVFTLFGILSFVLLLVRFIKEKDMMLAYAVAIILAFAVSGVAEWNFHLCNAFGISVFVAVTPLLFQNKELKVDEKH